MSSVPPPYPGPSQPKRDKSSTILLVTVVAVIGFCVLAVVAGGYFMWRGFGMAMGSIGPMAGCAVSFEAARDAVLSYAREHDGRLPSAATWQDDVKQYLKIDTRELEGAPFDIPVIEKDGEWGCQTGKDTPKTGMAFNSDLSGKKISEIPNPTGTVMLYEIEKPARNANGAYSPLPRNTSPKIFGENRGWITMPVEGKSDFDFSRSSSGIRVDTSR